MAADSTALHRLELGLQLFDLSVSLLEILVETVAFGNELLLPLAEALLLDLDLLSETLAECLLLLLKLGVVELAGTGLAKLACFHLLGAVSFVVKLLGGVDEIEHVSADENGSKLLKVAVVLILDLGDTPRVLTALDNTSVGGLDVLLGTNHSKWHSRHEATRVLGSSIVILLNRGLVNLNILRLDDGGDLQRLAVILKQVLAQRTRCLNLAKSAGLRVSALAMTGIRLTREQSLFMTSISRGLRVWPVGRMK